EHADSSQPSPNGLTPKREVKVYVPSSRKQASDTRGVVTALTGGTAQLLVGSEARGANSLQIGRSTRQQTRKLDNPTGELSSEASIQRRPAHSPKNRVKRMRWTRHLDIMRAYYLVTNVEQDRTNHRARLHEMWSQVTPDLPKEPQQLSGQMRSILRRNAISQAELEQLKREVGNELKNEQDIIEKQQQPDTPPRRRSAIFELRGDEVNTEVRLTFGEMFHNFEGLMPKDRPTKPKIRNLVAAAKIIEELNTIIRQKTADMQEPPRKQRLQKRIYKIRGVISQNLPQCTQVI
ncbi:hypothetical protein HHI36_009941, partial [Cryptolaemus montrouzieri]